MKLSHFLMTGYITSLGLILFDCSLATHAVASTISSENHIALPLNTSLELTSDLKEFNKNLRLLEHLVIRRLHED